MSAGKEMKELVKEKYGAIADTTRAQNAGSCCGSSCGCSGGELSVMAESYANLPGYNPDADLALGCGLPTEHAGIRAGDTVVDLGSGAGNDCFVARALVGETGHVIGIDMTREMLGRAQANAARLGYSNVEFREGDIEAMPVADATADVVVSNCVMNLVPDKARAFAETFRILKPGGHFSISDIVLHGDLPPAVQRDAALYAGCIAGAVRKEVYLRIIGEAGFTGIRVQKERVVDIPDSVFLEHMTQGQLETLKRNGFGVLSVTVYAEKPA